MAIEKIKCLRIIGTAEKLDETTEILVESECYQPDDPLSFHSDIKMFIPVQLQNTYADVSEKFYSVLDSENIKRSLTTVPKEGLTDEIAQQIVELTDKLQEFSDRKYKLSAEIEKSKHTLEQVSHFTGLDFPMEKINECRYIKANFGKLPKDSFEKMEWSDKEKYRSIVRFAKKTAPPPAPVRQPAKVQPSAFGKMMQFCPFCGEKLTAL